MKAVWWWVGVLVLSGLSSACSKNVASKPHREPVCPTTMVADYVSILNFERPTDEQLKIYEKPLDILTADEVLMKCMEFEENFAGKSCQASINDSLQSISSEDVRQVCEPLKATAKKATNDGGVDSEDSEGETLAEEEDSFPVVWEDSFLLENLDPYRLRIVIVDFAVVREQLKSPYHRLTDEERLINGAKIIQSGQVTTMSEETFDPNMGFCFFRLTPDQELFAERAIYVPSGYDSPAVKTQVIEINSEPYSQTTLLFVPYATVLSCQRRGEEPLKLGNLKQIFGEKIVRFRYTTFQNGPR